MTTATLSAKHRAYITARGLDPDLALEYGFRTTGEHIGFDYRRNGRIHNTKVRRDKGDMPWTETGKELILWNIDCLRADVPADRSPIIVEGEYDALACIQANFRDVVSVPNGAPAGENEEGKKRFAYLYDGGQLLPELARFQNFILAVDGDEKGLYLRDALAVRLGEERCLWVEWPEGCKDANDVLREYGPQRLAEVIGAAKRMFVDEVATLDDIPDPPPERSYHIGLAGLESHLRFPRSGFITVLGPYESGKSTFLRQVAYNMHVHHGWKTAITCFEEGVKWRTVNALRKIIIGRPRNAWADADIADADNVIGNNIIFIKKAKRKLMDGNRLIQRIEFAVKVFGVNMVIIDPFNEIDHTWNRGARSKSDYIGDYIMDLKDVAESYGILIICCVHPPTEVMRRNRARSNQLYTLDDSADSAHFANKSDIGLCIWRPAAEGVTLINIDKCKNTELLGKPTGIRLRFDEMSERFRVDGTGWDVLTSEGKAA
jgi:twinkle protein